MVVVQGQQSTEGLTFGSTLSCDVLQPLLEVGYTHSVIHPELIHHFLAGALRPDRSIKAAREVV